MQKVILERKTISEQVPIKGGTERIGVLILGMHRSGTSAHARVMSLLGGDLPKNLMAASSSNEGGHWESSAIMHLNDQILRSADTSWDDWLPVNLGWHCSSKAGEFKAKAIALLNEEFGASDLFVLKDPRICRLTPFWLDVFKSVGIQPAVIVPIRNPLEVADSLAKRDNFDPTFGQLLWLRHVLDAEVGTRGLRRLHCSYDELVGGWPQLISDTQKQLNISWPKPSSVAKTEIDTFLSEELHHHRSSLKTVSENPLVSNWVRDTFAVLHRWCREGETAADFTKLDQIRHQLENAAPIFAPLISSGRQSAQELLSQGLKLRDIQCKLSEARETSNAQSQHVEQLNRALEESNGAIDLLLVEKKELEHRLSERYNEIAIITRLLAEQEADALLSERQAKWLHKTTSVMLNSFLSYSMKERLLALLPASVRLKWLKARLKREGAFDSDTYLAIHKDVAQAEVDPLFHYIDHGLGEDRQRC